MTRTPLVAALVASLGCSLPGASASEPAPQEGSAVPEVAPGVVDGAAARRLVQAGVKVVDVRTPAEFAAGHVPGAVNIPFDELGRRHAELGPPSTPVLLYCRTGRRSGIAAETLRANGFGELYDLRSYEAWVRSAPAR